MELRLWEYIDGLSTDQERSAIEHMLVEHAEWRAKYKELLEVHRGIEEVELEQPSMRFTRNVMDEIARLQIAPATRNYINKNIIYGIAAFFITVIVGFLGYGISQMEWSSTGSDSLVGVDFSSVDYSRMFNNNFVNGFMVLNIILGLMLLDRYLGQRKKEWQAA
ncbi:hypothetical protein BUE76_13710 [Cnuella takakiae]|nr:hypothetical protein BUE76_13710 [Cnuella takakiae]